MKYNGQELEPITEPQIFDPPKKMICWDNDGRYFVESVWAIAPSYVDDSFKVKVDGGGGYKFCAEIPQQKPKRATYLQLAEWMAKGNGVWKRKSNDSSIYINYSFFEDLEEEEVENFILIRPFGKTEWVEPTLENMGMEDK
jgi:hypothetical protein